VIWPRIGCAIYGSSQIRMARLFARREKGISWTRTVLPINRQTKTQISEARRARANQVRRSAVVVLVVAKIAQSHLMALLAANPNQRVRVRARQVR
jgi:hypothetical protein